MSDVKVVKIDGQVYLGFTGVGVVTGIMLDTDVVAQLTKGDVARYMRVRNVDEFITLEYNTNTSAAMTRELDADEMMMFQQCEYAMATAKDKALAQLENETFNALVMGK